MSTATPEEIPDPTPTARSWGDPGELLGKLDFMWKVHEAHHELIRFADTKAGAALVLASAAAGWSLQAVSLPHASAFARWLEGVPLATTCVGFLATLLCSVQTIRPRIGMAPRGRDGIRSYLLWWSGARFTPRAPHAHPPGPPARRGLIFAGDVARHDRPETFALRYAEADLAFLADELARDLWMSAGVCQRKYQWVRGAVWSSAVCALGSIATLLVLALMAR